MAVELVLRPSALDRSDAEEVLRRLPFRAVGNGKVADERGRVRRRDTWMEMSTIVSLAA